MFLILIKISNNEHKAPKAEVEEHTCIKRAPKAAQEASSLMDPIQNFKAAQSTKANPYITEPFSNMLL